MKIGGVTMYGIQYAVDKNTSRQYAIIMNNGQPVDIKITAENPEERNAPRNEVCHAVLEDGGYVFEIHFGPNGKPIEVNGEPVPGEKLPAHHPSGAHIARQQFQMIDPENSPSSKPNGGGGLFDSLQDIFNQQPDGQQQRPSTPRPQRPANQNTGAAQQTPPTRRPKQAPATNKRMKQRESQIENLLEKYGEDLTEKAARGEMDPVIGRVEELAKLKQYLLRKKRSSVNLIGEAGVGKTAMFDALAQNIIQGNAEDELAGARVISLNLQNMNSGAKFRGQFEERLLPILEGLKERGGYLNGQKVILCIDEIHSALTAGKAEGGTNAGEIMKPYLSSEELTCIGATTPDEYKKIIEQNKALDRRFQPLTIEAPSTDETIEILKGLRKTYEEHHGLTQDVTDEQVEYIVKLTDRYLPARNQPDKAIGIIDDAGAIARMDGRTVIENKDIITSVAKAAKLKPEFLDQSDHQRFLNMKNELPAVVLGQDEAMEEIVNSLIASRAGLSNPDQPWGAFLLQGPTGTGKTYTAKQLAKLLHGSEDAIIRIDMAKYGEKHSISGLIGAPPGFVGHEDTEAELTEPVRQRPYSILVLDEVEKAHPDVFNLLLSILQDGDIKDQKGRTVSFRNTIILMTSNLGANEVQKALSGKNMGFGTNDDAKKPDEDKLKSIYKNAREKHFKPEVLNRIEMVGGCLEFRTLPKEVINTLVVREVEEVGKRLRENPEGVQLKDVQLEVSKAVKDALSEKGYDPKYGARPLQAAVQKQLAHPLAVWLLENKKDIAEKGPVKLVINNLDKVEPVVKIINKKVKKASQANKR